MKQFAIIVSEKHTKNDKVMFSANAMWVASGSPDVTEL